MFIMQQYGMGPAGKTKGCIHLARLWYGTDQVKHVMLLGACQRIIRVDKDTLGCGWCSSRRALYEGSQDPSGVSSN